MTHVHRARLRDALFEEDLRPRPAAHPEVALLRCADRHHAALHLGIGDYGEARELRTVGDLEPSVLRQRDVDVHPDDALEADLGSGLAGDIEAGAEDLGIAKHQLRVRAQVEREIGAGHVEDAERETALHANATLGRTTRQLASGRFRASHESFALCVLFFAGAFPEVIARRPRRLGGARVERAEGLGVEGREP